MLSLPEISIPGLILYAETHFRFFPFFPSLLYKREPEILFDTPPRIGPDQDLPVLLIINDLVRFPVEPFTVSVTVTRPSFGTRLFTFDELHAYEIEHPFKKQQRAFIFPLPRKELNFGQLFLNACVTIITSGKKVSVFNDNLNTSSKRAFSCFNADTPLPGSELCAYGDFHVHSQFSQSHVEFGPPLEVIDRMAHCSGLSFACITDHSYDLSCTIEDYLIEDPDVTRWKLQQKMLADGDLFPTLLLPGEEISCINADGDIVHLGAAGLSDFIPGSADGARKRKHLKFGETHTVKEAVEKIHRQGGIAFAAHPGSRSGLLQRIFLHRGQWEFKDISPDIDAIQALNSGFSASWKRGKALWIRQLQNDLRKPLIAGNDAHGDFSRYRAIKHPFLSSYEDFNRYMGYGKTGVYGSYRTRGDLLKATANGMTFVTNGPYISINLSEKNDSYAVSSTPLPASIETLYLHASSSPEFGTISDVSLFTGSTEKEREETVLLRHSFTSHTFDCCLPVTISHLPKKSYIRAETRTVNGLGTACAAFSSACFLS